MENLLCLLDRKMELEVIYCHLGSYDDMTHNIIIINIIIIIVIPFLSPTNSVH